MNSQRLRLSDVLGRVAIDAYEAVALVRAVAERVCEDHGGDRVPDLHQIELAPDGRISLSGAVRTDEPVRRLGQLLQATLVHADPPVQLRLRVSVATGPTPVFSSAREYADALAYFERPNRDAVLEAVYARAMEAPLRSDPFEATLDALAPLEESKRERKRTSRRRVPGRRAVAAMVAGAAVVLGGAAYLQFAAASPARSEISAMAAKASDAVASAVLLGVSSVTETAGLGRLVPTRGTEAPAPSPATPPASGTTGAARAASRRPETASLPSLPPLRVFDLSPGSAGPPGMLPGLVAPSLPDSAAPESSGERELTKGYQSVVVRPAIYSTSDASVTAPVGIRPQFPTTLPPDVQHVSQIEVVVRPDGTVASVKLLNRPNNVIETMLLSAAKAWIFTPALKDGKPVTYRKVVWLAIE